MPEKEFEEQQNSATAKGTLGEAIPADIENAMREKVEQNQEKIDAIIQKALDVYEQAKKTGPIHQAIEKADELIDASAKESGIGVTRIMELFTERIPPDELDKASQEVATDQPQIQPPPAELPVENTNVKPLVVNGTELPTTEIQSPIMNETEPSTMAVPETDAAKEPAEVKPEPPVADKIPPRLTRPRAEGPVKESEISDQEKDAIVQTTLNVFQETLKTSSVGAAENAARIKFRDSAWKLGEATYKELLQKITQEINELETAERERIKPAVDATVEKPAAPAVESPPPAVDISKPKNEELEVKDKENIITRSIEAYDEAITEGKNVAEAEAASLRKFTELVQGMERTEAVEIVTELKSVWREKKREGGKTPVPAPTVEKLAGPPVGTEKLDENKDDLAALREQARKLGLAFSDQASAEEIRNRIDEKIRFEKPATPAVESPPPAEPLMVSETEPPPPPEINQEKKPLEAAELTPEELDAIFAVAKAENIGDVEKLPEATKEKLGLGFNNLGFFVEENKNKLFAEAFEKAGEKLNLDKKGTWGRFVSSLAENYRRDQARAQEKYEAVKQGGREHLSNLSYLGGNILRSGRLVLDMTGYSVVAPLRFVMLGTMAFARGSEAAKEARFKNEETIEKTRVANVEIAEKEAWRIYEEAQKKAGDGEVSSAELKLAFTENLPRDIHERLRIEKKAYPTTKTGIAKRIVENIIGFQISDSITRIQKKIDQAKTETEKQRILKKYEGKLNDFNRLVSDYGEIDALALGAKISESIFKGARTAMTLESLAELPFAAGKIWDDLAGALGEKKPADITQQVSEIVGERREKLVDLYDSVLGVNSKDGLDADETDKITDFMKEMLDKGKQEELDRIQSLYGDAKIEGTSQTLEDYLIKKFGTAEGAAEPTSLPELKPPVVNEQEIKIMPSHFENTIEPGGDSVWKSTREIFVKNARELGYTEDKGDVTQWAETQTANTVKELADQEYGGKITDLVHGGDKVTVEIGADGRPHLKFENLSGQEPGYLPQAESDTSSPETVSTTVEPPMASEVEPESTAALETKPSIPTESEVSPPSETTTESGIKTETVDERIERLAHEYQALPLESKDEYVYNYIVAEISKPGYRHSHPRYAEKNLLAFVRMFNGGDWNRINSPKKLYEALIEFDSNLKFYTQRLVDGSLDGIFKEGGQKAYDLTANVFPVEARDGNIFYAQIQKNGQWRIADSNGDPLELKRPIMGKTNSFDLKNVKKLLGYAQ